MRLNSGSPRFRIICPESERSNRVMHTYTRSNAPRGIYGTWDHLAETLTERQLILSHKKLMIVEIFSFVCLIIEQNLTQGFIRILVLANNEENEFQKLNTIYKV